MISNSLLSNSDNRYVPTEWEIKKLGDLAIIQRGASPRPIDSPVWYDQSSKIGWVRISDVTSSNGKYLHKTADYFSERGISNSRFLPSGNLIMSICASVGLPIITKIDTCYHDGFVSFTQLQNIDREFLYYKLKQIESTLRNSGQTGSQSNLNSNLVRNIGIALPPLPEQRAIAEVLSDVDALIEAQEALIEKKRLIKQGVMQELLTGKRRLPGFSGEWIEKKLDECGLITMGQSPPGNSYNSNNIGLPLLNGAADLREDGISISQYTSKPTRICTKGDILFCIRATIGNLQIADKAYCLGRGVASITVDESLNKKFVAFQLQGLFDFMRQQSQGGVIKGLKKEELLEMKLMIPKSNEEQTKISEILFDLDQELELHQFKVDKFCKIKQGMMQELLTGRTRLV